MAKIDFSSLYAQADAAGKAAAQAIVPQAMIVGDADLAGNMLPSGRKYYVSEGVCGFASVVVKPANSPFVNALKKSGLRRVFKSYYGGAEFSIGEYNQSMQRKEAYAGAFAKVLRDNGLNAYSNSRMD